MATEVVTRQSAAEALEKVIIQGNLSKLNPEEKVRYYNAVCQSLGLNPLTRPFEYLTFQGKEILYAGRACTEQLRQIHGVSVVSLEGKEVGDLYVVTCRVRDRHGREDVGTGAVNLAGLKGDALANALMKCETKGKRRATLSLCGLGMLDETEVESIPDARREHHHEPAKPALTAPETAKPGRGGTITQAHWDELKAAAAEHGCSLRRVLAFYGASRVGDFPDLHYRDALDKIRARHKDFLRDDIEPEKIQAALQPGPVEGADVIPF